MQGSYCCLLLTVCKVVTAAYCQLLLKSFAQNTLTPFSGYQNVYCKTEVTASNYKGSALYSISRVTLTAHILWRKANCDLGCLTLEIYRSHTVRHIHSVGLLWTSDQSITQAATYKTHTKHNRGITMLSEGFEPTTTAIKRLHNYYLDRTVTRDRSH